MTRQRADQLERDAARRERLRKLSTFGVIGTANLVLYLIVYWLLSRAGFGKIAAGGFAFAACTVVSYLGNKVLTFRSTAAHAEEAPRFALTSLIGTTIATFGPSLLSDHFGLAEPLALAIVCTATPLQNFLLMHWVVFRNATATAAPAPSAPLSARALP